MDLSCKQCGIYFHTIPSRIREGRGKFCSKICYSKWMSENTCGENSKSWKGGEKEKKCEVCGNKFKVKVATDKKGYGKFCSRKCAYIWISKNTRGDKRYNWKGERSKKNEIRSSFQYKNWRSSIFSRDAFSCCECGAHGVILEAHHIKPFWELVEEAKNKYPLLDIVYAALIYPPLWDISNGKTLCKKCHRNIKHGGWKCFRKSRSISN